MLTLIYSNQHLQAFTRCPMAMHFTQQLRDAIEEAFPGRSGPDFAELGRLGGKQVNLRGPRGTTIRGITIKGNRRWRSQWVSCLPIWVKCADLDLVGHLLHRCATNVTACERDVHLLLLLVLFSVAHLHCRTYAVPMNNSSLPLVYLAGNCA
jgi:hypothetical protein